MKLFLMAITLNSANAGGALFALVISLIVLATAIIFKLAFSRERQFKSEPMQYPPENMSSADVAFWYKGRIKEKDLIELLIELANEGYLEIEDSEDGEHLGKKSTLKITRLKGNYFGNNLAKKQFFNALFDGGKKEFVYDTDLLESFHSSLLQISAMYSGKEYTSKLKCPVAKTARIFSAILSALTALIDFKILIDIPSFYELSEVYIEAILISAAIIISLIAFGISFFIKRKSLEAQENRHKIRCFKLYLESANKNEIVSTMQSNPKYFYDIFPYAYVLGLTSIYAEHFKNVPYKNPAWCKCNTRDYTDFYAFANHLLRSITRMLTHSQEDYYRINYRSSVEHDAKLLNEWINS